MKRKTGKMAAFLIVSMLIISCASLVSAVPVTPENALKIHEDATVVDTHNDTM